ncbi:hypothetical protein D7322_25685 [Sphingobacterium puteale]|uniref:Uncharacterized protein n=1 Tax=Sphingobacterium puteale TaxID=2420510 RepID=A0A420VR13_9SPHI|nr:hypothetical protein D7322_25685 [Sphingobacterium puteale]
MIVVFHNIVFYLKITQLGHFFNLTTNQVYKRRLDTDELEIFDGAAYEKYHIASREELLAVIGMLIPCIVICFIFL